jgi:hypothetical protein
MGSLTEIVGGNHSDFLGRDRIGICYGIVIRIDLQVVIHDVARGVTTEVEVRVIRHVDGAGNCGANCELGFHSQGEFVTIQDVGAFVEDSGRESIFTIKTKVEEFNTVV